MEKAELIRNIEVDYDPKGDVLYISFGKPQEADDSDITILNASKRMPQK